MPPSITFGNNKGRHVAILSDLDMINRRDFGTATSSAGVLCSTDPYATTPLLDGEWLQLDDTYKLVRGGDGAVDGGGNIDTTGAVAAHVPSFMVFSDPGNYPSQVTGMTTVCFMGNYEAETELFYAGANQDQVAIGDRLYVVDIAHGGKVVRGLIPQTQATGVTVGAVSVGIVTKLPSANGGKLRFQARLDWYAAS